MAYGNSSYGGGSGATLPVGGFSGASAGAATASSRLSGIGQPTVLVQHARVDWAANTQASTKTITLATAAAVGDVVAVLINYEHDAINSVSGLGATWVQYISREGVSSEFPAAEIWIGTVVTAGTTITVTPNPSFPIWGGSALAIEFSGLTGTARSSSTMSTQTSLATVTTAALTALQNDVYFFGITRTALVDTSLPTLTPSPGAFDFTEAFLFNNYADDSILARGARIARADETISMQAAWGSARNEVNIALVLEGTLHPASLTGQSAGVATVSAGLNVVGPIGLQGSSAGIATVSTTGFGYALSFVGRSDATATVAALFGYLLPFQGEIDGTAVANALLGYWLALSGEADGLTATTVDLHITRGLNGAARGRATVLANVAGPRALTGSSTGLTSQTTNLGVEYAITGSSAGSSTVVSDITRLRLMSGEIDGVATVITGYLGLLVPLRGTAVGVATTAGNITGVATRLNGSSAAIATVNSGLATALTLQGGSAGHAHFAGAITVVTPLAASSAGTSTVTATTLLFRPLGLTATATGVATDSVVLGGVKDLFTGSSAGVATIRAALGGVAVALVSAVHGVATVTAAISGTALHPLNDKFVNAQVLTSDTGTTNAGTIGATYETGEPDPEVGTGSIWYVYTPSTDGTLHVGTSTTPAPAWASRVDVYTGSSITALTSVALGDIGSDPQPGITDSQTAGADLMVAAGTTYYIRVQDQGTARDDGVLDWEWAAVAPSSPVPNVSVVDTTLETLSAQIVGSNLDADQVLTFNLQDATTLLDYGILPDTVTADESGVIRAAGISLIPVGSSTVPLNGNYNLIAHANPDISLAFTLALLEGDVPQPLPTAPTGVTQTGVQRWVFEDVTPAAATPQWIVPLNPDKMTSPFGDKNLTDQGTVSPEGQSLLFEGMQKPIDWSFGGNVLDETHYNNLTYWYSLPYRVYIIDHLNRAWEVYLYGLDFTPVRAVNKPWKHTYTMKARITRGPITPSP